MADVGYTICELILQTLVADQELRSAFSAAFGKEPLFLLGFDPSKPPKEDETPWIAIVPASSAIDEGLATREYELQIGIGAKHAETDTNTSGVVKYEGYQRIYAVVDLVQGDIYSAIQPSEANPNAPYTLRDLGRPTIDLKHPRYLASWSVRVASAF